jgi:hypothetical protein
MDSFIQQKPSASQGAVPEQARRPSSPPPMVEERLNAIVERKLSKPIRGKFPEEMTDPAKISEMKEYMRSLGCQFRVGISNPLSYDARLLSLAIGKYVEIFGCLPTQSLLVFQRLGPLSCSINSIYGGILGMRRAYGERKIPLKSEKPFSPEQSNPIQESAAGGEKRVSGTRRKALPAEFTSPEKIAEMSAYLAELYKSCSNGRARRPLHKREVLEVAIVKYSEIFGRLPTHVILREQRMLYMYSAILEIYGGIRGMQDADALGDFDQDKPRPELHEINIGTGEGSARVSSKKIGRASSIWMEIPAPKRKFEWLGSRMVCLDDCGHSPEEISMAAQFIHGNQARLFAKQGFGDRTNVFFSLTGRGPNIFIEADPKEGKFFFMEKEIPALIFIATMDNGPKDQVELAIRELASEMKARKEKRPEWLRVKIHSAAMFYKEHFINDGSARVDRERFSQESVDLLNCIFLGKDILFI